MHIYRSVTDEQQSEHISLKAFKENLQKSGDVVQEFAVCHPRKLIHLLRFCPFIAR